MEARGFVRTGSLNGHRSRRNVRWLHAVIGGCCAAAILGAPVRASAQELPKSAYEGQSAEHVRYGFEPNDPYFHKDTPSPGWPGQWHLVNEYTAGLDARVQGAWARNITGLGVTVGIVDDCLQTTHPDLAPNYDAADSYNFGRYYDPNQPVSPDPVQVDDQHGVSVGGVIAARGSNGIGVTGVAPYANLAGLRVDFPNQTDQMFVDATLYHSSGGNTTIKVKNHSYGVTADYIFTTLEANALETSAGAGTIHCFAAGNERADVNKKDLQNNPGAITVAALGSDGKFAYYSNYGAAVFVTAPSSSSSGLFRITTTDRTGTAGYNTGSGDTFPNVDYTSTFGGTSSASPLVAGVMALGKQVQPNLDSRFAKHLLARTCTVVDPNDSTAQSDGGWRTNAAGYHFNQNYGFGLVDANAFTLLAAHYTGVSPLLTESTGFIGVGLAIPDDNSAGITRTFHLSSTTPLEDLLIDVDITHTWQSDINIILTSPSGTTSRLVRGREGGAGESTHQVWNYLSNVFWGENPQGDWTINLADIWAVDIGTWNAFQATAHMGELIPEPASLALLGAGLVWIVRRRRR